jgi:hypothetical protein
MVKGRSASFGWARGVKPAMLASRGAGVVGAVEEVLVVEVEAAVVVVDI